MDIELFATGVIDGEDYWRLAAHLRETGYIKEDYEEDENGGDFYTNDYIQELFREWVYDMDFKREITVSEPEEYSTPDWARK